MLSCTTVEIKRWRHLCIDHLDKAVKIKPSFVIALADLALMYGEDKNISRYV